MKKLLKNNGKSLKLTTLAFTLIELLAVIIILAIVALIATPIILDVVEDARISAGRSEANMILSGINNYCATEGVKYQLDNSYTKICTITMNKETVKEMVNLGTSTIDKVVYDGEKLTELEITSNNHKFTLCPSGIFAMDNENCGSNGDIEESQGDSLISKLLSQYNENNPTGLLKDETNSNLYYYKGSNEVVNNNYLWYGGHIWRIIEFDTIKKTITLISQQPLVTIPPAADLWLTESDYDSTYINTWLNEYFYNSLDLSIQKNVQDNTFNIGRYNMVDKVTTTKKVGLLDLDQYNRAGGVDSYLDIKDYWWLGNTYSPSVVLISNSGSMSSTGSAAPYGVRPIIKINNINITKGKGTLTDNYRISSETTNIDNIQVGEYINVPTTGNYCGDDKQCTFRVVSKDENGIKVTLNGLLPTLSKWGNDTSPINGNSIVYQLLNEFLNSISTDYKDIDNKTFYIGDFLYNSDESFDYIEIQNRTLSVNIGLPVVGEMFSSNDIEMILSPENNRIFVDEKTLENPKISTFRYWTMNRHATKFDVSSIFCVDFNSSNNNGKPTSFYGVRPVMFLKNNLTFVRGEGTAQSPYELQ